MACSPIRFQALLRETLIPAGGPDEHDKYGTWPGMPDDVFPSMHSPIEMRWTPPNSGSRQEALAVSALLSVQYM